MIKSFLEDLKVKNLKISMLNNLNKDSGKIFICGLLIPFYENMDKVLGF